MNTAGWIYYPQVPKDYKPNILYRRRLRELAAESPDNCRQLWIACRRDLLFWVNAFCWVLEPRLKVMLPFITWRFQDTAFREIVEAVGVEDVAIEKSRDMSASWMAVTIGKWLVNFYRFSSILAVSRKAEYVESKDNNPKALFSKFDTLGDYMPHWLKPDPSHEQRTEMHYGNDEMKSAFDGEATTADSTVGSRPTVLIADEFGLFPQGGYPFLVGSRNTTKTRIFISSARGPKNANYDVQHKKEGIKHIRLHWTQHPEKRRGLYFDKGKPRSPYYDYQCSRAVLASEIAQEEDIDYSVAESPFYRPDILEKMETDFCRPPLLQGELVFDQETLIPTGFRAKSDGAVKLWVPLLASDEPPAREGFGAGADLGVGTGASGSACPFICRQTGEQVAELWANNLTPEEFARYSVAMCRWFNDAELIWEANGPGRAFGNTVVKAGYRRIYYRTDEKRIDPKTSDIPGWFTTDENKYAILQEFGRAMREGQFTPRSVELIREAKTYQHLPDGSVGCEEGGDDPTGVGRNHGDRVIGGALAWHIVQTKPKPPPKAKVTREGSLRWRREMAEREDREAEELAFYG